MGANPMTAKFESLVAGLVVVAAIHGAPQAAPFAYIANQGSNSVTVVDLATATVVASIPVGNTPYGVAADASGRFVYVTVQGTDTLAIIDAAANAVVGHMPLDPSPLGPYGVAVSPAGDRVYVANDASGTVTVIDTASRQVVAAVAVGVNPQMIVANAGGTRIYVSNTGSNTVSVIDAATATVVATIPVGTRPLGLAADPTGARVYVVNQISQNVSVIDTAVNAIVATIPVGSRPLLEDAVGIAVDSAGTRAYVTQPLANQVSVIDLAAGAVVATIASRSYPFAVAVSPDGTRVYVTNSFSNDISMIDAATRTVVGRINVGPIPTSIGQFVGPGPGASTTAVAVEYYHASLDHYFITHAAREIAALDGGALAGWERTGGSFKVWTAAQVATSPVCRYYIPPGLGDSHFFGRGTVECNDTGRANPRFVLEDASFMHMRLPLAGACPAGTTPVYRVFSNRSDANHRYMADRAVREQMVARGWMAEGDGSDLVVMCAPQ
jgi:YVTN family beta-propeller protein